MKPVITEKASRLVENKKPVYAFHIDPKLNKQEVKKMIKKQYGVTPTKVAIINLPKKTVIKRGQRPGAKPGARKALVYLKAGDKITLA